VKRDVVGSDIRETTPSFTFSELTLTKRFSTTAIQSLHLTCLILQLKAYSNGKVKGINSE